MTAGYKFYLYTFVSNNRYGRRYCGHLSIVQYSSFETDESGDDESLEPNTAYDDFQWILVRDNGGTWEVKTYGYG